MFCFAIQTLSRWDSSRKINYFSLSLACLQGWENRFDPLVSRKQAKRRASEMYSGNWFPSLVENMSLLWLMVVTWIYDWVLREASRSQTDVATMIGLSFKAAEYSLDGRDLNDFFFWWERSLTRIEEIGEAWDGEALLAATASLQTESRANDWTWAGFGYTSEQSTFAFHLIVIGVLIWWSIWVILCIDRYESGTWRERTKHQNSCT